METKQEYKFTGLHPSLPVIHAFGTTRDEALEDAKRQVEEFIKESTQEQKSVEEPIVQPEVKEELPIEQPKVQKSPKQ